MTRHEYFEELCALAASGQILPSQWSDLETHLLHCANCMEILLDFKTLSAELVKAGIERGSHEPIPSGLIDRLVVRAGLHSFEGSYESNGSQSRDRRVRLVKPASTSVKPSEATIRTRLRRIAISLISIVAFILGGAWEHYRLRPGVSPISPATDAQKQTLQPTSADVDQLKQQLKAALDREAQVTGELQKREDAVESAQSREGNLKAQIAALERASSEFKQDTSNDHEEIRRLQQELERSRSDTESERDRTALAEAEIVELRETVKNLGQKVDEATRLNATLKYVRDLLTDRNVHVWNVHDIDERGNPQKAFGRLFYSEGKRLTFYAFDLLDRKHLNTQISFYLWGEKTGTGEPARNLGVLKIDDEREGRWKLTVDDRNALMGIDGIFLTAEPAKSSANQPRGKRILFASLDPNANHR